MIREMAAEDAARPNPVTEDIIKEAAAILGDPPLSDADAAKMHDAMTAAELLDKVQDPACSFEQAAEFVREYMKPVETTADGVTVPNDVNWMPFARKQLLHLLANHGIHVPLPEVMKWERHQCTTALVYTQGGCTRMPDFLAHYAP